MSNYNNERLIELEAKLAAAERERDALRESVRAAFIAGCEAVHASHDPSDRHPDFSEAADDYAAALERQPCRCGQPHCIQCGEDPRQVGY